MKKTGKKTTKGTTKGTSNAQAVSKRLGMEIIPWRSVLQKRKVTDIIEHSLIELHGKWFTKETKGSYKSGKGPVMGLREIITEEPLAKGSKVKPPSFMKVNHGRSLFVVVEPDV